MSNQKVFLVYLSDQGHPTEDIEAIFDNFEDASAFTKRFKENSDFFIYEHILNPEYHSNKEKSPYCMTFSHDNQEHTDIGLVDSEDMIEDARDNKYWVDYYGNDNKSFQLHLCFFATSVEDAIAIGKKKRDDFIATGIL